MQDDVRGTTRRTVLRSAAIGAGVLWTAPVVRVARLGQAAGTPPPTTTTPTTSGPPTEASVSGEFAGPFASLLGGAPGCAATAESSTDPFDIGVLGSATLATDMCFVIASGTFQLADGSTFTLTTAAGTITGAISGTLGLLPLLDVPFDFTLTVESGTGAFVGATGTMTAQGIVALPNHETWEGTLAGSVLIP